MWLSHFFLGSACKPQLNPHTEILVVSISALSYYFQLQEKAEVTQQPKGKKTEGDREASHLNATVSVIMSQFI